MSQQVFRKIRKATQAINRIQFELAAKGNISVVEIMTRLEDLGIDEEKDGCWIWDIERDVEAYSAKYCTSFGYDKQTFGTSPMAWQKIICSEDHIAALEAYHMHVLSHGKEPYYIKVHYHHKDGSIVKVICEGEVVRWSNIGEPIMMFGWHTIVSDETHVEKAILGQKKVRNTEVCGLCDYLILTNKRHVDYNFIGDYRVKPIHLF